ncbi:type VI secretion system baseplate subunit TssE [Novosphingobium album (ex Liu et al. 2023)]|uniref:Type VI secretion system baseplate subunit TssE n=1 Tax=Novosphingobium album (ex Liu et al. 2023) TaxID=3031130 RepID=A0ABT5WUX1_9SPHN|nr:type VI secretion system baseplate subunit TssE [Novosphingobium album (ex Liu et al. 2023)]MDE8653700.1 type VI secretion system baseplate subunit TssE [Novosphingobium album (ex Liu et al. 2023)]
MAARNRRGYLDPTLFDKLVADHEIGGLRGTELERIEDRRETLSYFSVPQIESFNEAALRSTVRRELAWLLNTTNLESLVDLEPYPQVRTSVVNYGVPDMAGKALNNRLVLQRARDIRNAIQAFEPRIEKVSLDVRRSEQAERPNAITYLIRADVRSAVRAIPVKFRTDLEIDTAAVTVRE